ncbi:spore coat U domain-containing protein [Orbus sturtevantii]|uniref:Csu type fimbrial protein n=1 Tax=Orbus sturtevantii TaxID=3074109 RepID=UPI00370D3AF9
MKLSKKLLFPLSVLSLFIINSHQSFAATSITGTVGVSMTLIGSCLINGSQVTNNSSFGNLDFGTQNSLFSQATSTVQGSGGTQMTITCNAGAGSTPTITLVSGANDTNASDSYNHAMKNGSSYINYSLYSDPGHNTVIQPNTAFFQSQNTGSAETVAIYGKAVGKSGLALGSYTDTITLKIDF